MAGSRADPGKAPPPTRSPRERSRRPSELDGERLAPPERRRKGWRADEQARARLTGNERVPPEEQLEIYREQFWLRHTSSLLEDFEGLAGVIGQRIGSAWWRATWRPTLRAATPCRDLGRRMPEYVEQQTWLLELLAVRGHGPRGVVLRGSVRRRELDTPRPAALGTIPEDAWPGARLELAPALRMLQVGYPLRPFRRELRTDSGSGSVVIPGTRTAKPRRLPGEEPQHVSSGALRRGLRAAQRAERRHGAGPRLRARAGDRSRRRKHAGSVRRRVVPRLDGARLRRPSSGGLVCCRFAAEPRGPDPVVPRRTNKSQTSPSHSLPVSAKRPRVARQQPRPNVRESRSANLGQTSRVARQRPRPNVRGSPANSRGQTSAGHALPVSA